MMGANSGALKKLCYRATGEQLMNPVLRVYFEGPDREEYWHDLQNAKYHPECPALQFMARCGISPSDFDDKGCYEFERRTHIPVVRVEQQDPESAYAIAQGALAGAKEALFDAEWFKYEDPEKPLDDEGKVVDVEDDDEDDEDDGDDDDTILQDWAR